MVKCARCRRQMIAPPNWIIWLFDETQVCRECWDSQTPGSSPE